MGYLMSDPNGKTNKTRQPVCHNEREVAGAFTELAAFADGVVNKLLGRVFTVVKRSISFRLMMAGGNARLACCDEMIYECYTQLMRRYNEAIAIYENNPWDAEEAGDRRGRRPADAASDNVKNILHGIYSVLVSRSCVAGLRENPITSEKREIVNESVLYMMKNFDAVQKRFVSGMGGPLAAKYREANITRFGMETGMETMRDMRSTVLASCGRDFHGVSRDAVEHCLAGLNDINGRRATTYYYDILGKELDILKSIVKVQFSAIESEMSVGQAQSGDQAVVGAFLLKILEAYQVFSKGVEEITAKFQEAERGNPAPPPGEDFESFMAYLAEQTDCTQVFPTYLFEESEKENRRLYAAYEKYARHAVAARFRRVTGSLTARRELYILQKRVAEHVLLGGEVTEAFAGITRWRGERGAPAADGGPGIHKEIMRGICETIDIKTENLAENTRQFAEDCRQVFEEAKSTAPPIGDDEKKRMRSDAMVALFSGLIAAYGAEGRIGQGAVKALLDECVASGKPREVLEAFAKDHERLRRRIEKNTMDFLKDTLLFEMSTFEEVMNYSVSRLRESEEPYTADFVAIVDETAQALLGILKRSDIQTIAPAPHEPFNGKEQEVLMAEKNDEFRKGEVIKVMNSGYRQNGVVLLRANVIAAK